MAWNEQYKQLPQDNNNPGYGAAAIRDLKTKLEGLIGVGHNFDLVAVSNQGRHLPGTAILDLDSDALGVNHLQVGRMKATSDDTIATMKIKGLTADLNLKGYDQVSISGDETILGVKTFAVAPAISAIVTDADPDSTIANVGYVKSKTETINIIPIIENVSPLVDLDINDSYDDLLYTIIHKPDVTNLEDLLAQINIELIELRTALSAVSTDNEFGQDLKTDGSPTFDILTATKVYGAVWG